MIRRPLLSTILPLPRDSPIAWRDTRSYEPSSRIRQLDVPATDLTSDTTTGAIGPTPARPGSEATNPITTVRVIMAQSERVPLDIIASLLLLLAKKAVQLSRGSTVVQRRRWPRERRPRPQ